MSVSRDILERVIRLTRRQNSQVLLASADAEGAPHLAAAGSLELDPDDSLILGAWFCPTTVENVRPDRKVALIVWNPADDQGYQILGRVRRIEDLAVMDGLPDERAEQAIPQVERQLVIRAERAMNFRQAPHSDDAIAPEPMTGTQS
ncbi:MAG: pyridoxamine 5'-phosphate oxidase family protein [Planctomycetes bacterium]|nr:pyridoxamine 5'-phosphate oxidase family protein [Planctomycetota bacterium]